jgi:hypothetical protein
MVYSQLVTFAWCVFGSMRRHIITQKEYMRIGPVEQTLNKYHIYVVKSAAARRRRASAVRLHVCHSMSLSDGFPVEYAADAALNASISQP